VVGPVRERAGAVVAARAAVVVRWWLRGPRGGRVWPTEAVRGGVGPTETQRLEVTLTRGAHQLEREEGRGSRGLGREGEGGEIFSFFFTLVIYLFSEIE